MLLTAAEQRSVATQLRCCSAGFAHYNDKTIKKMPLLPLLPLLLLLLLQRHRSFVRTISVFPVLSISPT